MSAKSPEYPTLAEAHKELPAYLKDLEDQYGKIEIRSVCFHAKDPLTGGEFCIRIRGHIKTEEGVKEFSL